MGFEIVCAVCTKVVVLWFSRKILLFSLYGTVHCSHEQIIPKPYTTLHLFSQNNSQERTKKKSVRVKVQNIEWIEWFEVRW